MSDICTLVSSQKSHIQGWQSVFWASPLANRIVCFWSNLAGIRWRGGGWSRGFQEGPALSVDLPNGETVLDGSINGSSVFLFFLLNDNVEHVSTLGDFLTRKYLFSNLANLEHRQQTNYNIWRNFELWLISLLSNVDCKDPPCVSRLKDSSLSTLECETFKLHKNFQIIAK